MYLYIHEQFIKYLSLTVKQVQQTEASGAHSSVRYLEISFELSYRFSTLVQRHTLSLSLFPSLSYVEAFINKENCVRFLYLLLLFRSP